MAAKLETTSTPGIFRRHAKDCDRPRTVRLLLRDPLPRPRQAPHGDLQHLRGGPRGEADPGLPGGPGEFSALTRVTLHEYAREWIDRYQGTGRRGFREETRDEYRALLEKYALRYFPPQTRLTEIDPRTVADFIGWLVKQPNRAKGTLADSSVRNAFKPLAACLATARREGLIRHNPAAEATLPHRPGIDNDEEERRPLSRTQLAAFLAWCIPTTG